MNKVFLIGRLTRDPELNYTAGNIAVARFTLAVNRTFTNQAGEREADFINIVVWRKQAENVKNYLNQGSQVAIDGRIQTGSYEDKEGNKRYTTDVVADSVQFLDSKGSRENTKQTDNDASFSFNQNKEVKTDNNPFADFGEMVEIDEDALPF